MAGVTGIIKRTITVDGVTISTPTNTYVGDAVRKFSASVANGLTSVPTGIGAFLKADVLILVIDGTQPIQAYTNNATFGSAADVFAVSANNELLWWKDAPAPNPLTVDVTGVWAQNLGTVASVLTIVVLLQI